MFVVFSLKESGRAAVLASALVFGAGGAHAAAVVTIYASYLTDTPFIVLGNDTDLDFSDVVITSIEGPSPGETLDFGPLAKHGAPGDAIGGLFYAASGAFAGDYDDLYQTETSYQVTLISGGHSYFSDVFSPSFNLSGGYVDFLGLKDDLDFNNVRVAEVSDFGQSTGGVPEPASWALMILGFGVIGATMRHRRSASLISAAVFNPAGNGVA